MRPLQNIIIENLTSKLAIKEAEVNAIAATLDRANAGKTTVTLKSKTCGRPGREQVCNSNPL
jgi:hypothetical protein